VCLPSGQQTPRKSPPPALPFDHTHTHTHTRKSTASTRPDARKSLPSGDLASAQTINTHSPSQNQQTSSSSLPPTPSQSPGALISSPSPTTTFFNRKVALRRLGNKVTWHFTPTISFTLSSPFHQPSSARPAVRLRNPATFLGGQSLNCVSQSLPGNPRTSHSSPVHPLVFLLRPTRLLLRDRKTSRRAIG
jgi:hypothetical protein